MKVSLVITTYNNHFALRKVVESVMKQTRTPDEVIVADDGSEQDTAHVVSTFVESAPFPVRHVWQEHKGFRAARIRNEAIKSSSGDYIVLLDGDCVANRHFISDHLLLAEEGCFIQGKRVHVNRKAVVSFDAGHADAFFPLVKMALTAEISNVHHLIRFPLFIHVKNRKLKGIKSCNMSFFRKDILKVNGFDEDYVGWGNEDSDLACRFFRYGLMKKVHQFMAICFHLWHPTNKTEASGNKQLLAATLSSDEYFCRNGIIKEDQH